MSKGIPEHSWISAALFSLCPLVEDLFKENKQLEQGMKEILQAIQEAQQKNPTSQAAVSIPSLEKLVRVSVTSSIITAVHILYVVTIVLRMFIHALN